MAVDFQYQDSLYVAEGSTLLVVLTLLPLLLLMLVVSSCGCRGEEQERERINSRVPGSDTCVNY